MFSAVSAVVEGTLLSEGVSGKVVDVVLASGHGGGSFGLRRYWSLVKGITDDEDIVEVKEEVEPATSWGNWGLVAGDRFETLKTTFWGDARAARIYSEARLQGKKYVVRSRVKASLSPEGLELDDRKAIYDAQISLLAGLHRRTITKMTDEEVKLLASWLEEKSKDVSKLYETVFKQGK